MMLNTLLPLLLLTLVNAAPLLAQHVEARFTTDKVDYLAGEPVFVALTVSNETNEPVWLDFKSPDTPLLCHDFAIEVPGGAESAQEQWGCGYAGSCGRGLREVLPGKSLSLRRLVNSQFRLQPGAFAIRAHTAIVVHAQNLLNSRQIAQFDVADTLTVKVQRGNESQLRAAFQPFVEELDSPDLMKRSEAVSAITALAPPFLENVLIALSKSDYAFAAIEALRRADTVKTREALAKIASINDAGFHNSDPTLRYVAIRNLGRTNDPVYLALLMQLVESDDKNVQLNAAQAAGNLGGPAAVAQLAALLSSSDEQTRVAATDGLGNTHSSEAVPILIQTLLDSDTSVRQATVLSLWLLTHRAALDGHQWVDVSSLPSAAAVHQRWIRWWGSHENDSKMHGMTDCAPPEPLD
jgi:hypothetical protein